MSPHGRGVVSDIVFKLQREIRGKFDLSWQLSILTPGDGNGLFESQMIDIADDLVEDARIADARVDDRDALEGNDAGIERVVLAVGD